MSLLTGIRSYYKLDEITGTVAVDATGRVNGEGRQWTGTADTQHVSDGQINYGLTNSPYPGVGWLIQGVFAVDGDEFAFQADSAFTFSFWFKRPNTVDDNNPFLMGYGRADQYLPDFEGISLQATSNYTQLEFVMCDSSVNKIGAYTNAGQVNINDTNYHHILVSYDGLNTTSSWQIIVDGSDKTLTQSAGTLNEIDYVNFHSLTLGSAIGIVTNDDGSNFIPYDTKFDEFGIWDRALSPSEAQELYNGGSGVQYPFGLLPAPPSGVTQTANYFNTIDIEWVNNDDKGKGISNVVEHYTGTTWVQNSVDLTATTYQITGLTPNNNNIPIRVGLFDNDSVYWYSETITGTTRTILAPSSLAVTASGVTTVSLSWTNNSSSEGVRVYYKQSVDSSFSLFETVASGATTSIVTGLIGDTLYDFKVASFYNPEYDSNIIQAQTVVYPQPFCETLDYTLSAATCGNIDGEIVIDPDYIQFYDFVLTDSFGTGYNLSGNTFSVTAGWYELIATLKQAYWEYIDRETCTISWIKVENSDTTITNDSNRVRAGSCGVFGGGSGRIIYYNTDSFEGSDYDVYLFNENGTLVSQTNETSIDTLIISGLPSGAYYLMILNNSSANGGCRLLVDAINVSSETTLGVAGIKRIFVTQWNNLVEYNYWSASDENYYVSGVDSDFFSSIKIKEFVDSSLPTAWFEILMDTKAAQFGQVMNKTKQGFVFTDTITLTIPHADNAKWRTLVDFLSERHIVVFQDNNNQYWVMGYRHGATVDGYQRQNNEYVLTLNAVSGSKILTNIAEEYVINNIIA